MDVLKPVGYFMAFLACYVVSTFTVGSMMVFFTVPVGGGVFILSGVFTVVLSVIAAVMHVNYLEQRSEVDTTQIRTDHDYRMELLKVAQTEAEIKDRALEREYRRQRQSGVPLQVGTGQPQEA